MATGLRRIAAIDAMAGLPRPAWVLLAASGISNIGSGLVLPFLVVYLHRSLGFDLIWTTSTYAVTAVLAVVGSAVAGHAVDRYGAGRTFAAFSLVSAVGTCGYALVSQPWHALVAAALFGMGIGGGAGFNSALAVAVPPEQRSLAFGTNFALINAAIAVGSVLGGLLVFVDDPSSFRVLYVLNAVSYLVAGVIVFRGFGARPASRPGPAEPARERGYLRLLSDRRLLVLLLIAVVLYFVAYGQLESGLPALVVTNTELGTRSLSVIFAANTVAVVAAQLTLAHRIQRVRHTRALQLAAVLWCVCWALVALAVAAGGTAGPLVLVACAVIVFALAECLIGAALPAAVNAIAPEDMRGRYNAASGITLSLGMALGPLAGGALLHDGAAAPYLTVMIVSCAFAGLALVLFERLVPPLPAREAVHDEQRVSGVADAGGTEIRDRETKDGGQ